MRNERSTNKRCALHSLFFADDQIIFAEKKEEKMENMI